MKNNKGKYRVIEENRLAELLEKEQLADNFGFACYMKEYKEFQNGVLPSLVKEELNKYSYVAHIFEEYLDAENITDVSDEEKEDMLYAQEDDDCDCHCGCCGFEDTHEDDDDSQEGSYFIYYLEDEDFDDDEEDYDWDNDVDWADEFDDFYSDSFENSIFKEMEDFINEVSADSKEEEEEEEDTPDNFIISPELSFIIEGYFKKFLK